MPNRFRLIGALNEAVIVPAPTVLLVLSARELRQHGRQCSAGRTARGLSSRRDRDGCGRCEHRSRHEQLRRRPECYLAAALRRRPPNDYPRSPHPAAALSRR